jgi:hypothetical protein
VPEIHQLVMKGQRMSGVVNGQRKKTGPQAGLVMRSGNQDCG